MRRKNDGIIEAVRYDQDGEIKVVRAYERRGAVWSDRIMLERPQLVGQLAKGKQYMTGSRKENLGSVFETRSKVQYVDGHVVTDGQAALRDMLAGVPVF